MKEINYKDRVVGMFLGVAIGDALGMPLETMSHKTAQKKFGRVTRYIRPDGHKWFDGRDAGTWTDDEFLTSSDTKSIIARGKIDHVDIARRYAKIYTQGLLKKYGAGGTTRKAFRNLHQGISWTKSGILAGAGNGVAMKAAPLGALMLAKTLAFAKPKKRTPIEWMQIGRIKYYRNIVDLALITHRSTLAVASGLAQAEALFTCLCHDTETNFQDQFLDNIWEACWTGEGLNVNDGIKDKLLDRIEQIAHGRIYEKMSVLKMAKFFDGATCYVYNSLPFCWAAFLKNPRSIKTLYDVVNAGGDTDTNGSMVGALLGAYNGTKIFPKHLVNGLWQKDEIIATAERFCKKFGIGD